MCLKSLHMFDAFNSENLTGYSFGLGFRHHNTLFDISYDQTSVREYADFNPNLDDIMASIDKEEENSQLL